MVPEKSLGTGIRQIWYRKKVSEPVSEKFGTATDFRRQNLGIMKIYKGYRYHIGTGTGILHFFWWYRNRYQKNLSFKFDIGKKSWNRYRENSVPKKVPLSVSEMFGTGKKYRYWYRLTFWVLSHTAGQSKRMHHCGRASGGLVD